MQHTSRKVCSNMGWGITVHSDLLIAKLGCHHNVDFHMNATPPGPGHWWAHTSKRYPYVQVAPPTSGRKLVGFLWYSYSVNIWNRPLSVMNFCTGCPPVPMQGFRWKVFSVLTVSKVWSRHLFSFSGILCPSPSLSPSLLCLINSVKLPKVASGQFLPPNEDPLGLRC